MNNEFSGLVLQVRQENRTVDKMLEAEGSVNDWISRQIEVLTHNSGIKPFLPKEDLIRAAEDYVSERLGSDEAQKAGEALSIGALHTADHLGGFYSTQSFQGDLFFSRLLLEAQEDVPCFPILAGGCVPLGSSTYARGIIAYGKTKEAQKLPIYPRKESAFMASFAPGFERDMITKARVQTLARIENKAIRRNTKYLFDDVYLRDDILSKERFSDQAVLLGKGIMDRVSELYGGKSFLFLEIEEVFRRLILKELENSESLLYSLLGDGVFMQCLKDSVDTEGHHLSELLFKSSGKERAIPTDPESIKEKLLGGEILPGFYLSWLAAGLLRGFSFFGGVFQSCYLPSWHELTLSAMKSCGYNEVADAAKDYDFSGYISGPLVMLFDTGDGATGAGPLEVMAVKPDEERFGKLLDTDIRSAHEMGMFEFYNDLIKAVDKADAWYECIARYLRTQYPDNML